MDPIHALGLDYLVEGHFAEKLTCWTERCHEELFLRSMLEMSVFFSGLRKYLWDCDWGSTHTPCIDQPKPMKKI